MNSRYMRRTFSHKRLLHTPLLPVPSHHEIPSDPAAVHSQAVLCARLSRVLHYALLGLAWSEVRYSDRTRLKRSLTLLAGDIPLVWLIAGQPLEDTPTQGTHSENKGQSEYEGQSADTEEPETAT